MNFNKNKLTKTGMHKKNEISQTVNEFMNFEYYQKLNRKVDQSEKEHRQMFEDFSDQEILYYYVHHQKNRDNKKNRSPGTKREYFRELLKFANNIVMYAEEIGVDIEVIKEGSLFKSLAPRHLERYQEWMEKKEPLVNNKKAYSAATLARKNSIIKSFLSFLYKEGYTEKNLAGRMKSSTVSSQERPNRDLGPNEVIQILDFFYNENHPVLAGLIHVLVTSGMRNAELCNAKVKDLQYDSISESYTLSFEAKGGKQRIVPIKNKVYDAIINYRKARGLNTILSKADHSPLFPNAFGNPFSSSHLSKYLKKSILRTKLPFLLERENPITPHTFRHAYAIISYKSGADIFTIQKSLGHESYQTTAIYLQKILELEQNAVHSWNQGLMKKYV
jgi:integrase/recombinase XerD